MLTTFFQSNIISLNNRNDSGVKIMITIKDVAKAAGVSISTASYALNGVDKVSEKTREKVIKIAKELNYTPNSVARNLKTKKTELIGLFVHDINGPFYDKLIKGIQEVVNIKGYELIVFCDSGQKPGTSYNFLKERRIDGAIIISSNITNEQIQNIASKDFPIVVLDRYLNAENLCNVVIDNKKGAKDAVQYLIDLGHKKIGFISGPDKSYDNEERFKGYVDTLSSNSMEVNYQHILKGKFTEESGYDAIKNFLKEKEELPTAFFSSNDEMAIGAIKALQEENYRIPEDVAIVGFDDILISSYIQPKLTTVRRPMYEMGSFSAHILLSMLLGKSAKSSMILSTELIIRESCGGKLK